MIEALKPYSEYKESGVPWLGQVPKHWEQYSLWTVSKLRTERNPGNLPLLSVFLDRGVIPYGEGGGQVHAPSLDLSNYQVVHPGDFVLNNQQAWRGSVGVSRHHGIISPAYIVLRLSNRLNSVFANHLMRCPRMVDQFVAASKGVGDIQRQIFWPFLRTVQVAIPNSDEQNLIVRFLDHANGRIERAIRAKKKLIALLNEQKQAIIHRAVTRGVDPNAPLKPSGVSWLGDIPQHWRLISLRMRYSVELGKMLDAKRITGRNSIPYLRNRDVQWDRILVDELPRMDISPEEFPRYTVRKGDLLVCEGGQVGRCAFWKDQLSVCGFQKALHRVRALDPDRDSPRFFYYQMQLAAGRGIFAADGNESTIAHLTCEKLRRHRFAFPPFEEQKSIADSLDERLQHLHTAVARAEREIELLREYRTRFVADVVTGKLDVRTAARDLPVHADDPAVTVSDEGEEFIEEEQLA